MGQKSTHIIKTCKEMTEQERLNTLIQTNLELVEINKEAIIIARLNYRLLEICSSIGNRLAQNKNRNQVEESWYAAINSALAKKEL